MLIHNIKKTDRLTPCFDSWKLLQKRGIFVFLSYTKEVCCTQKVKVCKRPTNILEMESSECK